MPTTKTLFYKNTSFLSRKNTIIPTTMTNQTATFWRQLKNIIFQNRCFPFKVYGTITGIIRLVYRRL